MRRRTLNGRAAWLPGCTLLLLGPFVGAAADSSPTVSAAAVPAEAEELSDAWPVDRDDDLQRRAAEQVLLFKQKNPGTLPFFDEAYGFVIFPRVTRAGLGIGGAGGKGLVVEQGMPVATSRFAQFTSGIQAGVRVFRMIIFFHHKEDLEYFKLGKLEFVGQAGVSLGKLGASADAAYNAGVAVFTKTRGGLMVEATISGAKMTYRPLEEAP